jgi:hypothetical protein
MSHKENDKITDLTIASISNAMYDCLDYFIENDRNTLTLILFRALKHFEDMSDYDFDGETFIPNGEARISNDLERAIGLLTGRRP